MKHKRSQRSVLTLLSQYRGIVMGFAALTIVYFHEWQYLFLWNDTLGTGGRRLHRSIIFGPDLFFLMSGIGHVRHAQVPAPCPSGASGSSASPSRHWWRHSAWR